MKRIASAVLALVMLLCCTAAFSQGIDPDRKGSVAVSFHDDEGKPIKKNGSLSIYRVAGGKVENGTIHWTLTENFSKLTIDPNHVDNDTAAAISLYIGNHGRSCKPLQTVTAGEKAVFGNLPMGLYYVTQSKVPAGYKYYEMTSFLAYVPMENDEGITYDVTAQPKMEITILPTPTPKPPEGHLPQTGADMTVIYTAFGAGILLIIVGFGLILYRKKQ